MACHPWLPMPRPGRAAGAAGGGWRARNRLFGLAPTTVIRDDPELFWFVTGLPGGGFNSVMYANLAPDRVEAAIDDFFRLGETHGVPMGWLVGPSTRPTDLPGRL